MTESVMGHVTSIGDLLTSGSMNASASSTKSNNVDRSSRFPFRAMTYIQT